MKHQRLPGFAVGILTLLCSTSTALAQLSSFAVLGGSTVTNTNTPTIVTGNLGVSPGSAVTGFPPGVVVGGTIHAADATAAQAQSDLTTVYNQLANDVCNTDLSGQDLGGLTLTPGVYCFSTSAQLTGTLTLNGQGNPNALFVFKIGSTLTTASASSVLLINSATACGVFWQVGSSATLGTGTALAGSIVALTSITLNTGASVSGRALARNGAVTLDNNNVAVCSGGSLPGLQPTTLSKAFGAASIPLNGSTSLTFTIAEPATATLTGVSFVDTLPAGLTAPNSGPTPQCGGSLTVSNNAISLSGATVANGAPCTFSVTVTPTTAGTKVNTTSVLVSPNGGNAATAILVVQVPSVPTLSTWGLGLLALALLLTGYMTFRRKAQV
jgi:hypothetical protein